LEKKKKKKRLVKLWEKKKKRTRLLWGVKPLILPSPGVKLKGKRKSCPPDVVRYGRGRDLLKRKKVVKGTNPRQPQISMRKKN